MIRLITLSLILGLLALAVSCDDGEEDGDPTSTQPGPTLTETALESPEPPTPDISAGAPFRGNATIDGVPLPDNHPGIGAQVDGNNCGDTGSTGGVRDGVYEILVPPTEGREGCGTSGATVVFVLLGTGDVAGTEADQTGIWDDTQVNELDINFTTE